MKKILMIPAVLFGIVLLSGCGTQNSDSIGQVMQNGKQLGQVSDYVVTGNDMLQHDQMLDSIETSKIDENEEAGLILMREEEKLARDVYSTLYEQWGQRIFTNIAQSEQTHTEAVKSLLDRYEIEDPVKDDAVGKFTSSAMQDLYGDLVSQGSESLEDALDVGATVEDLDIKDLMELTEETDNEDIKLVYENLMRGSRNHLRAFVRSMERNGWSYSAQYMNQETYRNILNSEHESGSGGGGQGQKGGDMGR